MRTEIINKLIEENGYKRYLEIGIGDPALNFNKIKCDILTGVDPNMETDIYSCFKMTSDEFFSGRNEKFDLIFIDGLHTAEQTGRDIDNALNFLSDNGTIVVHDCNPTNEWLQRPEDEFSDKEAWCGDVWKAWAKLRATRADLEMFVYNTDSGVGIIKRGKQKIFRKVLESVYKSLSENRKELLNLKPYYSVSIVIPIVRPESACICIEAIKKHSGINYYEIITEEDTERIGCPKMVKKLVEKSKYDLVMFLGDDTVPQAGFMEEALLKMEGFPDGWGMVGLNEENRTIHWLAHKKCLDFLDGEFFHTGYNHCYCDDELIKRCKANDRFSWAKEANVKHNHPVHGTAKWDDDYKRVYAPESLIHDRSLYIRRNIRPGKTRVLLGMPLPRSRNINIHTAEFCFKEMSQRDGWEWTMRFGDAAEYTRNELVEQMMMDDYTHIFFLDADTFPPLGTIDRFLKYNKDIVAGITPIFNEIRLWNYQIERDIKVPRGNTSKSLFKAARTGATTILIKRGVFEAMEFPFYECKQSIYGTGLSHDYYWCDKVTDLGFDIWIDPQVVCGHSNTVNLLDMF